ncbi:hypothetical protein [Amycolatopsis sp. cmx-4-83]|uniref:hypothetical protein n=1 Tax=Amycolatopsis sp. cmx-4-83 TaxID=2790940 RepID=UPI00397DF236
MELGLLYPTRDRGEDDFAELCRRLDPAIGVGFAYPAWGPAAGRSDAAGQTAAVREIGAPERLTRAADAFATTPDVVSWACSSCSFTRGLDGAAPRPARSPRTSGCPRAALHSPTSPRSSGWAPGASHSLPSTTRS